jgi:GNAT superfamily N-acetyltransferase
MAISIRAATAQDASAVADVAAAAWRDTYLGILRADTIETFIERAYSIERLERRIAGDIFLVAIEDGRVIAFSDALEDGPIVELHAIYALPDQRGRGAGTSLLAALRERFPGKAIAAEVLAGNRKGEVFYERRGFVPRERIDTELFGETVVERRWWLVAD